MLTDSFLDAAVVYLNECTKVKFSTFIDSLCRFRWINIIHEPILQAQNLIVNILKAYRIDSRPLTGIFVHIECFHKFKWNVASSMVFDQLSIHAQRCTPSWQTQYEISNDKRNSNSVAKFERTHTIQLEIRVYNMNLLVRSRLELSNSFHNIFCSPFAHCIGRI